MVPVPNLLAFVLASVLLILLPGPSVLFVLGRSIALGKRGGLLSVLGNALGMRPAALLRNAFLATTGRRALARSLTDR